MKTRAKVTLIAAAVCLLAALGPVAGEPAPVVIADFETGVSAWQTSDGKVNGAAPSELCYVYAVAREEGDRTQQAAMFEFKQAMNTWAGARLQVSSVSWLNNSVGQIAMWLRGDGSDNTVDLTLRAIVGEERRDDFSLPPPPEQSTARCPGPPARCLTPKVCTYDRDRGCTACACKPVWDPDRQDDERRDPRGITPR